jgi:hypothetical protein
MGMGQRVTFPDGSAPAWEAVRSLLAGGGYPAVMRMIDGQLSFPDEAPPAEWRELRVGTPGGMVTLRREGDAVVCVTWGNAEGPLRQAWNALAWALAEAGGGRVDTPSGPLDAAAFCRGAEMPDALSASSG